jgi:DNA-binding NarL/FixJ family response regulator
MPARSIRVLVVEDYEPFQRFVASILQKQPELQIIGKVSDGLEAVQKAEELQPDLIVLDIGLPSLNGIEVARQIRKFSPKSKILFVSQESSAEMVQGALATGAQGYVVKGDAGSELLKGVNAVLRGEQFVGNRFSGHDFVEGPYEVASQEFRANNPFAPMQRNREITRRHEAGFYSDDSFFLVDVTHFIGAALKAGNAAIVVATESHRNSLFPKLEAHGVDIAAAIEQGKYISMDAADALSTFMINGMPDPDRFLNFLGNLIATAADAAKGEQARVAVFAECVNLLWAQGNPEATIRLEGLWNEGIVSSYNVDVLCGYSLGTVPGRIDGYVYEKICAEHSALYSR